VRFLSGSRRDDDDERLLWSRDIRFAHRLLDALPGCRSYELDSGIVVMGPSDHLTDTRAAEIAAAVHSPAYGLVTLDRGLPEGERQTTAQAASMIDAAMEAADRFYPAFDFLIAGAKSPKDAMDACLFETVGEA